MGYRLCIASEITGHGCFPRVRGLAALGYISTDLALVFPTGTWVSGIGMRRDVPIHGVPHGCEGYRFLPTMSRSKAKCFPRIRGLVIVSFINNKSVKVIPTGTWVSGANSTKRR